MFQIILNKFLESCKNEMCRYKTDLKQNEINNLLAGSYNFPQKYLLKTRNTI